MLQLRSLQVSLFLSTFLLLSSVCGAESQRPNFLLVLLDDAGWTDVECYGSRIQTPNINRLASQGLRFSDCHSAAPNCSPSRTGLLTGRTPSRAGVYSYLPPSHVMHLRDEEITVAELLKPAGYRTGHFGKWHLSRLESDQPSPAKQGFDYSLGTDNNASPSHHNPTNFVRNGQPVGKMEGYSCHIVVDETIQWLDSIQASKTSDPFFACVWFHEPHSPIASPPDLVSKYQALYPELSKKQATYHANIENADLAVGRLMQKIDELGVAENTVVFFTSDNGPLNRFSRVGLRGQKSHVWEGGHRVPGIFRWPGVIAKGTQSKVPISGVDYLPTVCDIAGVELPTGRELDGVSLRGLLSGQMHQLDREKPLYWFFYRLNPAIAIRDGDWSLVSRSNDANRPKAHQLLKEDMSFIGSSKPVDFQLYNLAEDLGQQTEVSKTNPERLRRLRAMMESMHKGVVQEGHRWNIPDTYNTKANRKIWKSE